MQKILCASESFRNVCKHLILFKYRGNKNFQVTEMDDRQRRKTNDNNPTHTTNNKDNDGQFFT